MGCMPRFATSGIAESDVITAATNWLRSSAVRYDIFVEQEDKVATTPLPSRCLTLVPCGHNFCSVCFVRWRRRSPCCPECRATVKQAVRNLAIDCVVEAFSQANPEAARSKQDTAAMERAERDPGNQAVLKWLLRGDPADVPQSHLDRQNLSNVPTPARNRIAGARTEGGQQGQQQGQPGRRRPSSAGSSNSSACVIS
eukprot:TRINITY_DN2648_c0_g2_i1.p2 TRINITY_DN2648_c0_g2~~TRINITY_DN2648_c0_g2_i1.p2  ORF type:complete len:198 (+),score=40.69 TRINITY_DN2648_c0_g2_i1:130-723(+)